MIGILWDGRITKRVRKRIYNSMVKISDKTYGKDNCIFNKKYKTKINTVDIKF